MFNEGVENVLHVFRDVDSIAIHRYRSAQTRPQFLTATCYACLIA